MEELAARLLHVEQQRAEQAETALSNVVQQQQQQQQQTMQAAQAFQALQGQTAVAATTAARSSGSLIDTRAIGKPRGFNGKSEAWAVWSFVMRAYLGALSGDYKAFLKDVESMGASKLEQADLDSPKQNLSRKLYYIL
eukprot:4878219-Amphidinium_carterae.1